MMNIKKSWFWELVFEYYAVLPWINKAGKTSNIAWKATMDYNYKVDEKSKR